MERSHHKQSEVVWNRPSYREARWERAVKVYTVNQESKYLLVQNVHALGVTQELLKLFSLYGNIEEYRLLDEYPSEPYTDVYWIKFVDINAARVAKKKLDNRSFFGKNIHVCYSPEFESVDDTREKLQQRRKIVASKTKDTRPTSQPVPSTSSHRSQDTQPIQPPPPVKQAAFELNPSLPQTHVQLHQATGDNWTTRIPPLFPHLPLPAGNYSGSSDTMYLATEPTDISKSQSWSEPSASQQAKGSSSTTLKEKESKVGGGLDSKEGASSSIHAKDGVDLSEDAGLYDVQGLSKSQRVAAYLASSSSVVGTASDSVIKRVEHTNTKHQAEQSRAMKSQSESKKGAATPEKRTGTGDIRKGSSTHQYLMNIHQQTISASIRSTKTLQPPLTGNKSLDTTVSTIRDQMNKVWQSSDSVHGVPTSRPPKKKKRKRI